VNRKWSGLLVGLALVAVANIGAFWFGKSFKLSVAVLAVSALVVTWLWVRHLKSRLVHDLAGADKETQDAVLAGLEEGDRKELMRKLGRDDG
jgi:membrane protein implicated in regulation of membrane protease activity